SLALRSPDLVLRHHGGWHLYFRARGFQVGWTAASPSSARTIGFVGHRVMVPTRIDGKAVVPACVARSSVSSLTPRTKAASSVEAVTMEANARSASSQVAALRTGLFFRRAIVVLLPRGGRLGKQSGSPAPSFRKSRAGRGGGHSPAEFPAFPCNTRHSPAQEASYCPGPIEFPGENSPQWWRAPDGRVDPRLRPALEHNRQRRSRFGPNPQHRGVRRLSRHLPDSLVRAQAQGGPPAGHPGRRLSQVDRVIHRKVDE